MTGDEHRGEDLKQETFARIFARRKDYRAGAKFSTWLWRIALNLCHDELRRRQRHGERPLDDVLPDGGGTSREFAAEEPGPDLRLVQREDGEIVRDALRKLPEIQRSALVLRHCEGLKLREIAEILEIPETTAAARVATGLAAVTRILEPQFAERKPAERRSLTIV
jgi:RNA polymerase sigma-70 factor (ECF subfamily)